MMDLEGRRRKAGIKSGGVGRVGRVTSTMMIMIAIGVSAVACQAHSCGSGSSVASAFQADGKGGRTGAGNGSMAFLSSPARVAGGTRAHRRESASSSMTMDCRGANASSWARVFGETSRRRRSAKNTPTTAAAAPSPRTSTPLPLPARMIQPTRFYPRWGQGDDDKNNDPPGAAAPTIGGMKVSPACTAAPSNGYSPRQENRRIPNRPRFAETVAYSAAAAAAAAASNQAEAGVSGGRGGGGGGQGGADKTDGRKRFSGLLADRFQHPFDLEATTALRRLPGLELAIRSAVPLIEDAVYMDNIANSILVGPNQMASLHGLLVDACRILDMQVPDLYIRQNPSPNAYTLAIRGKRPFIVLHTSLVDLMEPEEVQAVIAHELGHLKCEHGIWVTLATVLANGLYRGGFLGSFLADRLGLRRRLMRWSRAAEFTCDRAAVLVSQDVNIVVSALLKLAGGSVTQASELSVPEFLKQASAYDLASKTRIGRLLKNSQSSELTHPLPVIRARELVKFSESSQYLGLVRRGLPL